MVTKTEENIKKMLEEHITNIYNKNYNLIQNKVHPIFICGVIIGIILSYTGLLGFTAGVVTAVITMTNYNFITENVPEKPIEIGYIDKLYSLFRLKST